MCARDVRARRWCTIGLVVKERANNLLGVGVEHAQLPARAHAVRRTQAIVRQRKHHAFGDADLGDAMAEGEQVVQASTLLGRQMLHAEQVNLHARLQVCEAFADAALGEASASSSVCCSVMQPLNNTGNWRQPLSL